MKGKKIRNCMILLFGVVHLVSLQAQIEPVKAIGQKVLDQQVKAWNMGNIEAFMDTYWKSTDLQFISKNGMAKGWEATRDRYYKTYPDRQAMGILSFEILRADRRSRKVISVIGKYQLEREDLDDLDGLFVLILQRMHGAWKIVLDSTH